MRPNLNLSGSSESEDFQNIIVRPVIKLQHTILLEIFKNYFKKYHITIQNLSVEEIAVKIEIITKNIAARNLLLGIIIGMFTKEEYIQYSQKSTEYNKRIITMINQRLKDSIEELI